MSNKPSRIERIITFLEHHCTTGSMTFHEAQVVHGLFRHACGFFAGRAYIQLCNELLSLGGPSSEAGSTQVREVCRYAIEILKCSAPTVIQSGHEKSTIAIFTDGSWENGVAGIGAVVIDEYSGIYRVFAGKVEESLITLWTKQTMHIICQIELHAMVFIRWSLREFLTYRRCIFFVDNDAARFSVIKGSNESLTMRSLVRAFLAYELTHPTFAWIERVASVSSPADSPSRNNPSEACALLNTTSWEAMEAPPELVTFLRDSMVGRKGGRT